MHIGLLLFNFVHLQTLATQNAEKCFDEIQSVNETEKNSLTLNVQTGSSHCAEIQQYLQN